MFNAQRKIENIVPLVRNDAHKLIEECMIMANVSAAKMLEKHQASALFRIHDQPDADRLSAFIAYLGEIGVPHRITDEATPADFTDVVNKTNNRPDYELIQTMLLRSMKQAVYEGDNIGHFGLALDAYAHFTSPIRRYPDLVVHRAIKATLKKQKQKTTGGKAYTVEEIEQLGEQCSTTERRADDATRDVADWLKCEFMLDRVGESFEGVVASVTNFGLFVRLTEYHIDGLVHITSLDDDYYHYDDVKQALMGESGHNSFRLGDQLTVKVVAVNLDERKIDLVIDGALLKGKKGKKVTVRTVSKKTAKGKGGSKGREGRTERPTDKRKSRGAKEDRSSKKRPPKSKKGKKR